MKNCKVKGHMRDGKKVKPHSRLTKQEIAKYGTGRKKKSMIAKMIDKHSRYKELEH